MDNTVTMELPLFPLSTVLYPDGRLSLRIFEQRYVDMTIACLREHTPFGVVLIRAGFETGTPAIPCDVGCTARIVDWTIPSPGLFTLVAHGESVFRIRRRWTLHDGLIMASVEIEPSAPALPLPEHYAPLATLLRAVMEETGEQHFPKPRRLDDAAWVAHRLAELMPVPPETRQKLLETREPLALLDAVEGLVKQLGKDR